MVETIIEIGKNFVNMEVAQPESVLLNEAKNLIINAYNVGGKIMKFQVHNVDDEIHPQVQMISPHFSQDRYEWVKRNTYSAEFWRQIKEFCRGLGVEFLATPMSRGAAEILDVEVGVDRWKIGSADILDFVMLDYIRDSGKPVILSSGMSTMKELKMSYEFLKEKTQDVSVLHCVSNYPCKLKDLNLNLIPYLKKEFGCKVGFSDHSLGIEGIVMAVRMGAEIIEKHFTVDRNAWGPDHKVSLLPEEMGKLIGKILNNDLYDPVYEALGQADKGFNLEEDKLRKVFRKGLYASRDMEEGEMLEIRDIISLRPAMEGAAASENYPHFVGKTLNHERIKDGGLNYEVIA